MPTPDAVLTFAALSFALIVVPGPSVMFVVSRGVTLGKRAALLTVVGNAAGVYTQLILVALGLGVVVARSVALFTAVKLAGAVYLVWLGVQAIRHRNDMAGAPVSEDARRARSVFTDGFIVGVANPKAVVFFAAILPQYVTVGAGSAVTQMAVLGAVFAAIALVSDSIWGILAGSAREWLSRSPHHLARLGGLGGMVMIGLGLQLAVSGRSE